MHVRERRIMVFGKPGGGKSTLAREIAGHTGLPHYPLDLIQFSASGEPVPFSTFKDQHDALIAQDAWIVDGLGPLQTFWDRVAASDMLVYVDLPYRVHYWRVAKRFLLAPIRAPLGWPKGSSIFTGTLASIRTLKRSPTFWDAVLLKKLKARAVDKSFIHLRSEAEVGAFLKSLRENQSPA
ncbi:hypothetical protein [Sphingomicrobium sediminis]|uniref:Adenylate kinase n=1 Tax=Sphingomicrobium sediminis TaxID=2950949 RepID=A0A9X2EJT4_9SPHN|nr:hypothetical protein [Sphingomicrobium sediminis]MCM8556664.1 hypothetical protein [Sphingomicrobium sediminis]